MTYLSGEFHSTVSPVAVGLDKVTGLVSQILAGTESLRMGRRGSCRRICRGCGRLPFDFGCVDGAPRRGVSLRCDRSVGRLGCLPARLDYLLQLGEGHNATIRSLMMFFFWRCAATKSSFFLSMRQFSFFFSGQPNYHARVLTEKCAVLHKSWPTSITGGDDSP